ncbi:hypothetical protein HDZ31DRAFT_45151 [Schizophyllum fasciatum]
MSGIANAASFEDPGSDGLSSPVAFTNGGASATASGGANVAPGIPILPTSFPSPSASAVGASASDDPYAPPSDDATDVIVGTDSVATPTASASDGEHDFPLGTTSGSAAMPSASTISPECRTMYTVMEGDICQVISDEYTVSLTQLLAANPGLDSDCGNLEEGEQLCIPGTPERRSRFFRF